MASSWKTKFPPVPKEYMQIGQGHMQPWGSLPLLWKSHVTAVLVPCAFVGCTDWALSASRMQH